MDLRVKIQPKEIFIYSMYNFWAGLRGIGCIILTVLVIIAAAASEERLGTQGTNLVILGVIALPKSALDRFSDFCNLETGRAHRRGCENGS